MLIVTQGYIQIVALNKNIIVGLFYDKRQCNVIQQQ